MVEIKTQITGGLTLEKANLTVHEPKDPMYPDVFIGKLRNKDRKILAEGKPIKGVKLGVNRDADFEVKLTEALVQDLHGSLMKAADEAYILM